MSEAGASNPLIYPEDPGVTGNILPLRRDPAGGLHLAMPGAVHDAVNSAYNALVGPGEVLTGRTPSGAAANPDIPQIASDITGTAMGLGLGAPVESGAFRTFGGRTADTFDPAMGKLAEKMRDEGYDQHDIWKTTGQFFDVDGQLKHEIADTGAKLHLQPWNKNQIIDLTDYGVEPGEEVPLGQIASLPAFQGYPELAKDIKVKMLPADSRSKGALDSNNDGTFTMMLRPASQEDMLSTILHETQHAIQTKEGFALGGSSDNFLTPDYFSRKKFADGEFHRTINDATYSGAVNTPGDGRLAIDGLFKQQIGTPMTGEQADLLQHLYRNFPDNYDDMQQVAEHYGILQKQRSRAFEQYQNLAGEVEARNVQERFGQGDYSLFPHATPGYPRGKQIVQIEPAMATSHLFEPVEGNPFGTPVDYDPFGAKP